jgi:protocatechuate 3,4-dioxygenase beta subunit
MKNIVMNLVVACTLLLLVFGGRWHNTKDHWSITIASKDEPGEPMVVTGTVYASDGKTPLPGMTVYVYHTDAKGYYHDPKSSDKNPRLRGTMTTNSEGKYEYSTIRPASYPDSKIVAHVHYKISGKGYKDQTDELEFEGDQFLEGKKSSGQFSNIQPITKDKDGVWRCVKDILMK